MYYVCLSALGVENAQSQRDNWSYAEIRIDLVKPTSQQLIDLLADTKVSYIATCRPGNDFNNQQSLEMLVLAAKNGADYVDIEIERDAADIAVLKDVCKNNPHCKLIISYHNFDETPDLDTLDKVISKADSLGADCVKIACKSNSEYDNAKLLSLYVRDENIVAFGMGKIGAITRVASVKCGAPFTYVAPDDGSCTAPGQLSLSKIKSLEL